MQKPLIDGALIAFCGKANVDVSGRDRNTVDDEEAAAAVMRILKATEQKELLAQLLASLRGTVAAAAADDDDDDDDDAAGARKGKGRVASFLSEAAAYLGVGSGRAPPPSWLLRTPRFTNRLLETEKEFFLRALGVPKGAVFVSSRTTASKDAFVKWAAQYLASRGAPLHPLGVGASKILFAEVSAEELEGLCVRSLLAEQKTKQLPPEVAARTAGVKKLLKALPSVRDRLNVSFHPSVGVSFVHGRHCFVPAAQPLSRHAILRLLNVVQKELGSYSDEFTHLQQAIFETLTQVASDVDVPAAQLDAALERAKAVKKEAAAFARGAAERPSRGRAAARRRQQQGKEVVSLDDDDDDAGPSDAGPPRRRRRQPRRPWRRRCAHLTRRPNLEPRPARRWAVDPAAGGVRGRRVGRSRGMHPAAGGAQDGGGAGRGRRRRAALRRGDGGGDRRLGSGSLRRRLASRRCAARWRRRRRRWARRCRGCSGRSIRW